MPDIDEIPAPRSRAARVGLAVAGLALTASSLACWGLRTDVVPPETEVHDVTELIHIPVQRVVTPTTTAEIEELLARHEGPVSIGGGRFSMGGQIGTDGTLFLDLRQYDDVLELDAPGRRVRVEAGITWRKLIEALDPHDLSVKIMQSYADFTVGGTLSVNAHGRYVNLGPVVHSVRSFDLVLADGGRVHCSREENPELFFGAIGGYGALGVIAEVELEVADNVPLERTVERMPVGDFQGWFAEHIEARADDAMPPVFFNADLYPPDYDELVAITFSETDREVTVDERIQPGGESSAFDKLTYWWVSEAPLGKEARSEVIDRMRLAKKPVVWRNHEASYDVRGLDPGSRERNTYVLQEYFIPVERFDDFVPKMRKVFQDQDVNVVNVSIRHATADPDTVMTWAPTESYAFVVYHKMGTSREAWDEAGVWSREMADAILSVGGKWYLPYQIHMNDEQLHEAYPRAKELFALKAEVDPTYKLRNRLWDRYLPPSRAIRERAVEQGIREHLAARDDWARPEDQTFLTLPEWYIVYSADELGAFLTAGRRPSDFPFYGSVGQFWDLYGAVRGTTHGRYPTNTGYHAMIWVIGLSYTVEYAAKGAWEGTVGSLTEGWSGGAAHPVDAAYAKTATAYGAFLHHTPWYAFDYKAERKALPSSDWSLRGLERSVSYTVELWAKGVWGWMMGGASQAAYGTETGTVLAWVDLAQTSPAALLQVPGVGADGAAANLERVEALGGTHELVRVPRYEPFTTAVPALARRGVRFVEIAGGDTVLVQLIVPSEWDRTELYGDELVRWPILTEPGKDRVTLEVPVPRLHEVVPGLDQEPVRIEHLYDY